MNEQLKEEIRYLIEWIKMMILLIITIGAGLLNSIFSKKISPIEIAIFVSGVLFIFALLVGVLMLNDQIFIKLKKL